MKSITFEQQAQTWKSSPEAAKLGIIVLQTKRFPLRCMKRSPYEKHRFQAASQNVEIGPWSCKAWKWRSCEGTSLWKSSLPSSLPKSISKSWPEAAMSEDKGFVKRFPYAWKASFHEILLQILHCHARWLYNQISRFGPAAGNWLFS